MEHIGKFHARQFGYPDGELNVEQFAPILKSIKQLAFFDIQSYEKRYILIHYDLVKGSSFFSPLHLLNLLYCRYHFHERKKPKNLYHL